MSDIREITLFMRFVFLLLGLVWVVTPAGAEPTYAERLGWSSQDRVLILHVDDIGMSHASNRGAIEALEKGMATSVSMMMPCSWVSEFAAYLKDHPDVDVGLHLTLTSEWDFYRWGPVAGKPMVPGLVDQQGCLWDNVELVKKHASPDEVETEIRAQIDRAVTMGIHPTHLDSHMGTLFEKREFLERLIKVGIEKQIPVLMVADISAEISKRVWDAGLPVLDHVHTDSYDWKTTDKTDLYIQAIRDLKPGITEIIMHCTKPDDVIPVITGNREHLYGDLYAMVDPRFKEAVQKEGIILTTWRELKKRRDRVDK